MFQVNHVRNTLTFLLGGIFGIVAGHTDATTQTFTIGHAVIIIIATAAFHLAHATSFKKQ